MEADRLDSCVRATNGHEKHELQKMSTLISNKHENFRFGGTSSPSPPAPATPTPTLGRKVAKEMLTIFACLGEIEWKSIGSHV